MWCSSCQQDVPAVASPEDRKVRCFRCRADLMGHASTTTARSPHFRTHGTGTHEPGSSVKPGDSASGDSASLDAAAHGSEEIPGSEETSPLASRAFLDLPPLDLDAWFCNEELHAADRLVRKWAPRSAADADDHGAHGISPAAESRAEAKVAPAAAAGSLPPPRHESFFAWSMVSLGVMSSVFGGALLAWSFWEGPAELWRIGLPFALGGQVAFILGMLWQLDSLAQSNQQAVASLTNLDQQLVDLRRTAARRVDAPHAPHSLPSSLAYHWAESCLPSGLERVATADKRSQADPRPPQE